METPKIEVKDNGIVLPVVEAPIIVNGEEKKVVMQVMTAGQRREIIKNCVKTRVVGNQLQGDVDASAFQIPLLAKAIKSAPFEFTEKGLEALPDGVVDYLYEQYSNAFTKVEKKD